MSEWREVGQGISVKVSLDWELVAEQLAVQSSEDQAQFFESLAEAWSSWAASSSHMQFEYIADQWNDPERMYGVRDIRWMLTELLERVKP